MNEIFHAWGCKTADSPLVQITYTRSMESVELRYAHLIASAFEKITAANIPLNRVVESFFEDTYELLSPYQYECMTIYNNGQEIPLFIVLVETNSESLVLFISPAKTLKLDTSTIELKTVYDLEKVIATP